MVFNTWKLEQQMVAGIVNLLVFLVLFNIGTYQADVFLRAGDICTLPDWPSPITVRKWPHQGVREKCFCGYAQANGDPTVLDLRCSNWEKYVSQDGSNPDKIHKIGTALILGIGSNQNSSKKHYGSMTDWSIDFGNGYGKDCSPSKDKTGNCASIGFHLLSLPSERYMSDCCGNHAKSLKVMLLSGNVCGLKILLEDMIGGALQLAGPDIAHFKSCDMPNEDPTRKHMCMAQCFHIKPDVNFLHMHTTAGVFRMRDGPTDSGLGPDTNGTESGSIFKGKGKYNLCVCEPAAWKSSGRGYCPKRAPGEVNYVSEAVTSLCKNLAGISTTLGSTKVFMASKCEMPCPSLKGSEQYQ